MCTSRFRFCLYDATVCAIYAINDEINRQLLKHRTTGAQWGSTELSLFLKHTVNGNLVLYWSTLPLIFVYLLLNMLLLTQSKVQFMFQAKEKLVLFDVWSVKKSSSEFLLSFSLSSCMFLTQSLAHSIVDLRVFWTVAC